MIIIVNGVQTAYSVGRYEQMKETADARPYWMYMAVGDDRTRPEHMAHHRKVYPFDHDFWDTWYPPNGFNCRCTVINLSQRQVDARGITVETQDPTNTLIEPIDANGKTMPARQLIPDKGFAYNPGKVAWGDPTIKESKFEDMKGLKTVSQYPNRPGSVNNVSMTNIPILSGLLPDNMSDSFYLQEFKNLYGDKTILKDPAGLFVTLTNRIFELTKGSRTYKFWKGSHGPIIPLLGDMIKNPFEIWIVPQIQDNGKVRLIRRYISLWKTQSNQMVPGMAVFEVVKGELVGVTAFMPETKGGKPKIRYADNQRKGILIYGK